MLFQKKIDRAMEKLHEDSDAGRAEREHASGESCEQEKPELEKGDFLAMTIAAIITILPVAILVLLGLAAIMYFTLVH